MRRSTACRSACRAARAGSRIAGGRGSTSSSYRRIAMPILSMALPGGVNAPEPVEGREVSQARRKARSRPGPFQ
jgi:hypothetical protein